MSGAEGEPAAFLAACRGEQGTRIPVWFMRQAGRSLPEYRAARGEGSMLDTVRHPELAAELTLQPVRRYGVDAAILFSDIMVPLAATGFGVEVTPGVGPVVPDPFARQPTWTVFGSSPPQRTHRGWPRPCASWWTSARCP